MVECGISHNGFSQGGIDSNGENYDTTWSLRTDFAEVPRGLQSVSVSLAVRRKIWSSSNQEYYYSDTTSGTSYVYFYDKNLAYIGNKMVYNSKTMTADFFNYLNARYVRLRVSLSASIYPDDSHDTTSSYYFLADFSANCLCVEWEYDENSKLIHEDLKVASEKNFVKPYPKVLWRLDYLSPNLPYNQLFPNIRGLDIWSLDRENVIRVYDFKESQDGFHHNGLAILAPSECVLLEELNGRFDVELTHPMDDFGRWKFLLPQNILKIGGQLFRIGETVADTTAQTMQVHAKSVWYDLADSVIIYNSASKLNGIEMINFIINSRLTNYEYNEYHFHYNSDITSKHDVEFSNVSPVGALIGTDGCFIDVLGGELYRNNFYFSINSRMENAKDNAFSLRYSSDIVGITQKIDYSNWCTWLVTEDNLGNRFSISFTFNSRIHHHKFRYKKFNYSSEPESSDGKVNSSLKISAMERLKRDAFKLWNQIWFPSVEYTVNIASMRQGTKYSEFLELQNYRVGDRGTIYCDILDINTVQQIVSIEKDMITGDVLNIRLGNTPNSIIRPNYRGENAILLTDDQQEILEEIVFNSTVATPITTADGKYLITQGGKYILYEKEGDYGNT